MNSGVIDNFLGVFTQYIDSGFGLLGPEVGFLARTLVLIDIILAALFWSWAGDEDVIARLGHRLIKRIHIRAAASLTSAR